MRRPLRGAQLLADGLQGRRVSVVAVHIVQQAAELVESRGINAPVLLQAVADAGPELEEELIAYCREHLAHYKCPRSVDFRAELPRHPTGKLYKRLLKDEYWK